jgi:hypothetical protein
MKKLFTSVLIAFIVTTISIPGADTAYAKGNEKKQEKHEEKSLKKEEKKEMRAEAKAAREEKKEQKKEDREEKKEDKQNEHFCSGKWGRFANWLWLNHAVDAELCAPKVTPPPTPDTTAPVISSLNVVRTNPRSVVIDWKTNEPTSSIIQYGSTTAYGLKKKDANRNRNHRIVLAKLTPDTLYHFNVVAKDRAGNTATSSDMTFRTLPKVGSDTTAPVISGVSVNTIATSSARISWNTNENATGSIDYGTTTLYGSNIASATLATSQNITVTGLEPSTVYHFRVTAEDASSNNSSSSDITFTTSAGPVIDATAPIISGVIVTVGTSTTRVQWTTNESASGKVDFGTTTGYGSLVAGASTGTAQDIMLTNLAPSTLYHFKITAQDPSLNSSVSADAIFTTLNLPVVDTTAPNISNVTVTAIGSTTATISWNTNEASTGKIYYSSTSPLNLAGASSVSNVLLSTNHSFILSSLAASTTHHFILESKDGSNNATTSSEFNFTTTQ